MFNKSIQNLRTLYTRYWWFTPLTLFIVWRILLEIVGRVAFGLQPDVVIPWSVDPDPPLWARWDSGWYDSIVRNGYHLRAPGEMSNVTFFPLFPLLWKLVQIITPFKGFTAALLLTNALTVSGFLLFYRWTMEAWGKAVALKALIALALFPTSFFLISAYSESTLFLATSAALLFSSRRRWVYAAVCAALASAARPTGIFLWPLILWLWYSSYAGNGRPIRELAPLLLLPPLGLVGFSAFLFFETGDALAWFSGQSAAGRGVVMPLKLIGAYILNILNQGTYWPKHLAEMAALAVVAASIPVIKKLHPAYALFTVLHLAPSLLSNTLTSIQRFALLITPLFIAIGFQRKFVYGAYCVIAAVLLFYSIHHFVAFQWAG